MRGTWTRRSRATCRLVRLWPDDVLVRPKHYPHWSRKKGALSWIVFGFLAGLKAKWLTSGSDPKGCIVTVVIGIVGAAIGGWVGTQLGLGEVSGFDLRSLALAVVGSILLLLGLRAVSARGLRNLP